MSDNILSIFSQYATAVALVPATAALILTERGSKLIPWTFRTARTTLRPSEGTCSKRSWADVRDDNGEVHTHVYPDRWPSQCQCRLPHVSSGRCWERTIGASINRWRSRDPELCHKPSQLQLSKEYLHVDADLVRAFIFMAVAEEKFDHRHRYRGASRDLSFGDIVINRQVLKATSGQDQDADVVLLHLLGSMRRNMTKSHIQMLLGGGPPLLPGLWMDSIHLPDDERRGGWVVAVGLIGRNDAGSEYSIEDAFLPIYVDSVKYADNKRGAVFWQSIDRVLNMLADIWLPAFETHPDATHIRSAIRALEYMRQRETESGVNNIFDFGIARDEPPPRERRSEIISHFNGPPIPGRE
jgi:hypothetical protein